MLHLEPITLHATYKYIKINQKNDKNTLKLPKAKSYSTIHIITKLLTDNIKSNWCIVYSFLFEIQIKYRNLCLHATHNHKNSHKNEYYRSTKAQKLVNTFNLSSDVIFLMCVEITIYPQSFWNCFLYIWNTFKQDIYFKTYFFLLITVITPFPYISELIHRTKCSHTYYWYD